MPRVIYDPQKDAPSLESVRCSYVGQCECDHLHKSDKPYRICTIPTDFIGQDHEALVPIDEQCLGVIRWKVVLYGDVPDGWEWTLKDVKGGKLHYCSYCNHAWGYLKPCGEFICDECYPEHLSSSGCLECMNDRWMQAQDLVSDGRRGA